MARSEGSAKGVLASQGQRVSFEVAHSVQARSVSKGIAVFYRRIIVPRIENLNSLAGASGLYFVANPPLVVIMPEVTRVL